MTSDFRRRLAELELRAAQRAYSDADDEARMIALAERLEADLEAGPAPELSAEEEAALELELTDLLRRLRAEG